jgi:hypothetical protein
MSTSSNVHFKFLPMSMRVLFTSVLVVFGTGYMMAMIQVWEGHAGKDGEPGGHQARIRPARPHGRHAAG